MKKQYFKDGERVVFNSLELTSEEWESVDYGKITDYEGRLADILHLVAATEPGEKDHEYYTIRFLDGTEFTSISGYHLRRPNYARPLRLQVYKEALKKYKKDVSKIPSVHFGMCFYLSRSGHGLFGKVTFYEDLGYYYPEFLEVVPREYDNMAIWPAEDVGSRLKAFERMIELVK